MLIHDMTRQDGIDLLARARLGRLACAYEAQPYITPMNFAYDDGYLYSFSTLGQKITWMRANPLVCVEADELASPHDWATVIVLGKYEELLDKPEHRQHAHDLLRVRPVWWEPGYAKTVLHGQVRPLECVYFRIRIDQISGHRGVPDTLSGQEFLAKDEGSVAWLRRILGRHQKGDH
jgi:nitroimidazol reductase NimA-like FMN-containing flavoprotein (pyridoxamine 5'-phosphate oxidase superfamily)